MSKVRMAFDIPEEISSHIRFYAQRKRIDLSSIATEALATWLTKDPFVRVRLPSLQTQAPLERIAFNLPAEIAVRLERFVFMNNPLNYSQIATAALQQWTCRNPLPDIRRSEGER